MTTPPRSSGTVSIEFDNAPYVPVYVNGHGPLTHILDTGAVTSDVNVRFDRAFNLPVSTLHPSFRTLESFRIGQMEWTGYDIGLREEDRFVEQLGRSRDGFIGYDLLQDLVVEIDYLHCQLRLANQHSSEPNFSPSKPENTSVFFLEYEGHDRFPHRYTVVSVNINNQGPYRFLLDTGAGRCVVSPEIASQLGLSQEMRNGRMRTRLQSMEFCGIVKNEVFAYVMDCSFVGTDSPLHGFVGHNFLEDLSIILDYPKCEVSLISSN